jgi:A/G-specific adenine glycosylase
MLQQTQVSRVLIKYDEFLKKFPSIEKLADASLRDVLTSWQGLGYNRRAKFLYLAAIALRAANPRERCDYNFLLSLPGVGQSTAGALIVFTQNTPIVFIETNIRAVLLYHFFKDTNKDDKIHDREIVLILEKILDNLPKDFGPRDFYYELYDYGSFLKESLGKEKKILHEKSKSYAKQSKFKGSRRQLRAFVLRVFLVTGKVNGLVEKVVKDIPDELKGYSLSDVQSIVKDLKNEGMLGW